MATKVTEDRPNFRRTGSSFFKHYFAVIKFDSISPSIQEEYEARSDPEQIELTVNEFYTEDEVPAPCLRLKAELTPRFHRQLEEVNRQEEHCNTATIP